MKCRSCWSDKAYVREEKGVKAAIYSCFGLVPLKCQHCFDKRWILWFMTWGQTVHPPKLNDPSQTRATHDADRATRRRAA